MTGLAGSQLDGPNRTVLITGATDGIGLALARHYQSRQMKVILNGRRPFSEAPLVEFDPVNYCQADLTHADSYTSIKQWLDHRGIRHLDLLIHNAGLGYHGATEKQPPENIKDILTVNLWAPIALTHTLLPYVASSSGGKIVFIGSVVSTLPCPEYAVYGAGKAALDGFVRNLRQELGNTVEVQIIHPGATRTGMHAKSGLQREMVDWERFPSADDVAAQIAAAIGGHRPHVTIGFGNRLLGFAGKYLGMLVDPLWQRHYRRRAR